MLCYFEVSGLSMLYIVVAQAFLFFSTASSVACSMYGTALLEVL